MASQSLYRAHRPQRFGEIVAQEHVTTALRNAVREDRLGHAYLFSGPRGTGKTTTARILARALNCLDLGADGEPCGVCENCASVAAGTFYDLVELDAASNRGVEAMRDLIQSVSLGLGPRSRRKVYVIDEVHMLTADASNTLLKTLEEPPPHVVFVLATTESQKVLPTIRSRTQHYEFTLLSLAQLEGHLADVLEKEGGTAAPEALELVARRAAGSARDALSILDQALAFGDGELDAERIAAVFGGTPFERRLAVLQAAAAGDVAEALVATAEALAAGSDPRQIADDLLRTLRDAFVLEAAEGRVPLDEVPDDQRDALAALVTTFGRPAVVRGIETLGQAIVDLRGQTVVDPRLVLEVAVVRIARGDAATAGPPPAGGGGTTSDEVLERLERLERRVQQLGSGRGTEAPAAPPRPARPSTASAGAADPSPPLPAGSEADAASSPRRRSPASALGAHLPSGPAASPPAPPEVPVAPDAAAPAPAGDAPASPTGVDTGDVILAWEAVLGEMPPSVRAAAESAQPLRLEGDVVVFGVPPTRMERTRADFRAGAEAVKDLLASRIGFRPKLQLVVDDRFADAPAAAPAARPARAGAADAPPPVDDAPPDEEPPPDDEPPPPDDAPRGGARRGRARPAPAAPAPPAAAAEPASPEADDVIDLEGLVDAPDAPVHSAERLVELFDAEVVEERPRERPGAPGGGTP